MRLKTLSDKLHNWLQYRATVRQLGQLTDRELADIGLRRFDIAARVRANVPR